jgi:hypothetical protein
VFTVADRSAVVHAGDEGVLGGVAGTVVAAADAEDAAAVGVRAAVVAGDAGLPAELLGLVDPQAAARAPAHSRVAAVLILRAAWADGLMGVPLSWRGRWPDPWGFLTLTTQLAARRLRNR